VQGRSESRWRVIALRRGGREMQLARGGIREHDTFLGHEMRGPAGTGRGGVLMAGGQEPKRKEGEWGETIETNCSRNGLRLTSDNLRRCCRLQDRGAVQGRSSSYLIFHLDSNKQHFFSGGVRADGVASLIVAAGERRSSLGMGFENMMRSWVMK